MTKEPLTVNPSNSATECMRIMTERRVRHLPVLEGTKLVGILSIDDVVNWLMAAQKATIDNLEGYSLAEIKEKNKTAYAPPFNLQDHGIIVAEIHRNLPLSALYEHAIRYEKDASIAENGALFSLDCASMTLSESPSSHRA